MEIIVSTVILVSALLGILGMFIPARRRLILVIALLALAVTASAQNNPYDIDDECYELYQKVESVVGTDKFREANEAFLHAALAKQDIKAQVLYYVANLKNLTWSKLKFPEDTPQEDRIEAQNRRNQEVLEGHEKLKSISRTTGYMQYFYYSYSLTKNYFYNNGMALQAVDLLREMRETAIAEDNSYGEWYAAKEMSSIYQVMRDYKTTREYLIQLLDEYENTDDPMIKRQLVSSYYVDLADTYPAGSDSSKYYLDIAASRLGTRQDTIRTCFAYARHYAAVGDRVNYRLYRDQCFGDPLLERVYSGGNNILRCIDHVFDGTLEQHWDLVKSLPVRKLKVIEKVADAKGQAALAYKLLSIYVDDSEDYISQTTSLHLEEMEARMGNARLTADLAKKSHQVEVISVVISILVIVILLLAVLFLLHSVRQLRRTNERVRLADEAKTRFIQNMSHEVRTPLNAIVGFSQLLSMPDGTFPPEEKDEFAGHIVNNTKMLTMLLDDILNASAMDKGSYKITYEQGDCPDICHSSISSSEHRLQPGVSMKYVTSPDAHLTFTTDPQRVQQILTNLLTNACKHTPSGEIRLGWTAASGEAEGSGTVEFFVEDTGPGVPADKAEAIFDRFTKLNDFVQGTGLGLSICREIADKMGGRVYLDTSYTSGARFVLSLPLNPPR